MSALKTEWALAGGVLLLGAVGLYVWKRGGLAGVAQDAAGLVVKAAGGAVRGGVDAVSEGVGLPTTSQTTTDAAEARWIIDHYGWFEASKWSGAGALFEGMRMDAGTGSMPGPNSEFGRAHPDASQLDQEEAARLLYERPMDYGNPSGDPGGW